MKFFTRELYDDPHPDSDIELWNRQCEAYRLHLASIRSQLPESMQAFCDASLHDGLITAAIQPNPEIVQLEIDASRNPWGPKGFLYLVFTGVREVSPLEKIVDQWWLYNEVHLHPTAAFDYRVLFTEGEFRVVAEGVALIETLSPGTSST